MAKNLQMSVLLDFYAPVLTQNQSDVLRLYYNEDLSLAEIAEGSRITRQGVRDAIKRGEASMLELEEKLGFARWYGELREKSDAIYTCANEIRVFFEKAATENIASKNAEKILELLKELDREQEA